MNLFFLIATSFDEFFLNRFYELMPLKPGDKSLLTGDFARVSRLGVLLFLEVTD